MEGLLDSVREGKAGLTRVITAAPGAGKSALLRKLEARWKNNKTAQPALLEASFFSHPERVIAAMFNAIDEKAARRFGVTGTNTKGAHSQVAGNVFVAQTEAGGHLSHSKQRTNLPKAFFEAFRELNDRKTPVVLLVDEAQMWGTDQEDRDRRISNLLAEAHMNLRRLPVLIVAAGLGEAPEVVAQSGASKLATENAVILGALSDTQMREVCQAFFDRYRLVGGGPQRAEWTEAILAGTDGWPRHLTNALRGAAKSLIAGQGDLAQSSLEAAQAGEQGFRRKFYYDQTKPFQRIPELLAAVFNTMPGSTGAAGGKIENAIDAAYEAHPKLDRRMARSQVFTALLHQGLIQDFGYDHYDCPIPSLRNYAEEFCAARGFPVGGAQVEATARPRAGPQAVAEPSSPFN